MTGTYSESGLASELSALVGSNFEKYLESELRTIDANSRMCKDDVQCRWLQGQAQAIAYLLKQIREADSLAARGGPKQRQGAF